jgi:hypothetical protein
MNTTYYNYDDVQAYQTLESERARIELNPQYQQWVAELKVSQSYVSPEGTIKAKYLTDQYSFSTSEPKSSFLNFLKLKGIWS